MINSKTLKFLRKAARTFVGHLPVRLLVTESRYRMVPDYEAGVNLNGTLKMKPFLYPMPARNSPETQRTVYRQMKKNRALVKAAYAR